MIPAGSHKHLTDSDFLEVTQSVWDERKNKGLAFLSNLSNNRDISGKTKPEFMEHVLHCPRCLYLLWESIESLCLLSEMELISRPAKLALKLNTMKNSFQAFIKQGFMLPFDLVPAPVLRSEATSDPDSLIEAAYCIRIEGIKNLFILNICSKTNAIQFNIRGQIPLRETLNISLYEQEKKTESQSIGRSNPKATFSVHYEDVQTKHNIKFLINSNSVKKVELLEMEL